MEAAVEADGELVWRALADPTRRRILDLLRERPRTTGDIASHFAVTRIAVMRHLGALVEARLVTSRKRGRERWHYLNAVPLQRIHERWVSAQTELWASRLLLLSRKVDRRTVNRPAIDVALDVEIAAPPQKVFAALTEDPGGWWGHPYLHSETRSLTLEPKLGGVLHESWDDGGAMIATVTSWTTNRHLEMTGSFHLGLALGIASFDLVRVDEGTRLKFAFAAFGAIEAETVDAFAGGWRELIVERLKTLVETGKRLGVAPDPPKRRQRVGNQRRV
jgi:DNA-binding transcriptional ArsR family regulator/uncharacterized protein YndB with AHSA1/START domain